jgi:hypothetical protein
VKLGRFSIERLKKGSVLFNPFAPEQVVAEVQAKLAALLGITF